MNPSQIKGLWFFSLAMAVIAVAVGLALFDWPETLGIIIGAATGLVLTFMLQRMANRALSRPVTGKGLILSIFLKSFVRFLLTGLILAILFYLGWLKPLGFIIGFTAVMVAIFAWGCSRLFVKSN